MVFLDHDTYYKAKNIALGTTQRSPLANQLALWAAAEYAIKILDIQVKKLEPPAKFSYELRVIVANAEDYRKTLLAPWERNEQLLTEFARQYLALAAQLGETQEIRLTDLHVVCTDFSDEAMTEANWKATKEFGLQVKRLYPTIWEVMSLFDSSVVFYFADAEIAANEASGVSQAVTDKYYSILKQHDDLNLFSRDNIRLLFDSKENVDKNYAGSLFYYSRG